MWDLKRSLLKLETCNNLMLRHLDIRSFCLLWGVRCLSVFHQAQWHLHMTYGLWRVLRELTGDSETGELLSSWLDGGWESDAAQGVCVGLLYGGRGGVEVTCKSCGAWSQCWPSGVPVCGWPLEQVHRCQEQTMVARHYYVSARQLLSVTILLTRTTQA